MNYRFFELSKKAFYGLCLAAICGGFSSCTDDYDLDDKGNYPSWLGNSIYDELKNPNQEVLTGTFNNYVRLIEDLGYAETLGKTGSKTIFPANDEAFDRFFKDNTWGVSSYSDLTDAMKKELLYSSMLDNAILVEMLSNATVSGELQQGVVLKHTTGFNIIDSITHIYGAAGMPKNNTYWEKYYDKGIDMVMDATQPMLVHFTAEQMIGNNITTRGDNSDFEIITGTPYSDSENSAYIFRNKIIHNDVTCKNGYIHQLEDVLVPPGNLAEVLRTNGESNYFSRMLDRFSAPFFDVVTTNNYNDVAQARGVALIDSIYQKRYFSERSQGGSTLNLDPNGTEVSNLLLYDPGWNSYTNGQSGSNALSDLAAIFVPTDEAMKQYLLPGGSGSFLIEQFGAKENTEANLPENIDSIPQDIIKAFLNNLMKASFINTVPSKFGDVMDDASDPMGLSTDVINRNSDGTYDVKIANNGVAYMLNTVFAPNQYVAVSAPALFADNMRIMNTAIQDGNGTSPLGYSQHFYAYLLAMGANYAFFIPTDEAFGKYYVDPATLGHTNPNNPPRVLQFSYQNRTPYVFCTSYAYDPATNEIGASRGNVSAANFRSQLIDILNYHTVVLENGEVPGENLYYKTKHGGEIRMANNQVGSGGQLDEGLPMSNILQVYNQKNGTTYSLDEIIQAPQRSVYDVLTKETQFQDFYNMCYGPGNDSIYWFASDRMWETNNMTKKQRFEGYSVFVNEIGHYGLDMDVKFFNSYNYTLYAPDKTAMDIAFDRGLPTWDDVREIYETYKDQWNEQREAGAGYTAEVQAARDKALAMVDEINNFLRYHFQDNSVYVDKKIEAGTYSTACSDTLGIREKLEISGGSNVLTVTDKRGNQINIQYNPNGSNSKMVNQMTRDYVFNSPAASASAINTSSFAVVHQISTPLNPHADTDRYDALWTGARARAKLQAYRRTYDSRLYKQY
ncbi:MAG: fasciclin domain-containing protein [Prevotella sp.]|nr:fasciclin domain-containing protein [Prevotella sp.]